MGIDPGTTTGVAVFDLDGNLILTHSQKHFSFSDMSAFISGFGQPIIIAGDITPSPKYVERMATVFSARLITPKHRLSRKQKNQMVRTFFRRLRRIGFRPGNGEGKSNRLNNKINKHERDAIVSALYALRRIRPIVNKINKKISRLRIGKSRLRELGSSVKTSVILRGENITSSIRRSLSGN